MTQLVEPEAPHEPGLRERKKRATRRALQRAALELVAEHGMDEVTVEQIAAAADVSPRTFFNYFPSKEESAGRDRSRGAGGDDRDVPGPAGVRSPLQALRAVSLERAAQMQIDTEFWRLRSKVVKAYPELGARLVGASIAADFRMAQAVAERMGVDPRIDPRPMLLAGATTVAKRTAMGLWLASDQQRDLVDTLTACYVELGHLDASH